MNPIWPTIFVGGLLTLVASILWHKFRKAQLSASKQLAMLQFDELRISLEVLFLQQASATGKPRGLRWVECELQGDPLFAMELPTDKSPGQGDFYAFVATTVRFEAIEGGPMEEVEAVGNLRSATAVFVLRRGQWATDGRVVFNLGPKETCERFQLVEMVNNPLE